MSVDKINRSDIPASVHTDKLNEIIDSNVFFRTDGVSGIDQLIDREDNPLNTGFLSEAGGTINGALNIKDANIQLYNNDLVKGTNPASDSWLSIVFNDRTNSDVWQNTRLGCLETCLSTDGTITSYLRAYNNVAGSSANTYIGVYQPVNGTGYTYAPTPAANDNSTKIATTAFVKNACDGQWVNIAAANQEIYNGHLYHASNESLSREIKSIPNDGKTYEVLFTAQITTKNVSGDAIYVVIKTDKITSWAPICGARTRAAATVGNRSSISLPVTYGKHVTIGRSSNFSTGSTCELKAIAYRRVGNNT